MATFTFDSTFDEFYKESPWTIVKQHAHIYMLERTNDGITTTIIYNIETKWIRLVSMCSC